VAAVLFERGVQVHVLDGDDLRRGLCRDLGYSPRDRSENLRRAAEVTSILVDAGMVVIVSLISPYRSDREMARAHAGGAPFLETFIDCPLDECMRRDPKGLYQRARSGEIDEMTGLSAPYQPPERPDIHLRTDRLSVADSIAEIVGHLEKAAVLQGSTARARPTSSDSPLGDTTK
jgi:adenylyl-sulfate kinase